MPRERLLADVQTTLATRGLIRALEDVAVFAEGRGNRPPAYNFSIRAVRHRLDSTTWDKGTAWMPDKYHSTAAEMVKVLKDAFNKNYNIADNEVFKRIYFAVAEYITMDHVPMRVLGSTAEDMVKKVKKGN